MKTITYKFADGTTSAVEVSDEFYSLYEDMEKADGLSERKHSRRNQSLEHSVDNGWHSFFGRVSFICTGDT